MFIGEFVKYLKVEHGFSVHTLRAYETDLKSYESYLASVDEGVNLLSADGDLIRGWLAHMMDEGHAVSSIGRKLSSLRTFYAYMQKMGVLFDNPAMALKGPKKRKVLPVFVRDEEMEQVFECAFGDDSFLVVRNRLIFSCFYETGVRLSELCGLNISDIDFFEEQIKVRGKRNKERIIPFGYGLKKMLAEYLIVRSKIAKYDENAFFVSKRGGRLSDSMIYRMVRSVLTHFSIAKRRGPHTLRHTFATTMLNNGAELGAVKELLGHKRLTTTEVYTHVTFDELKRVYKKAHPRAD